MLTLLGGLGLLLFALLRVFSVFTTVSTMGLVLGVASLVVVLAVTSGFEREFEDKVLAVNAHMLVMSYGEPGLEERERVADEYMKKLKDLPGLRQMAKFSLSAGEVMIGKVGANLKGIDVTAGSEELRRALLDGGNVEDLATGPPAARSVPAGPGGEGQGIRRPGWGGSSSASSWRAALRAKVGDCVSVLVPFAGEDPNAEPGSYLFQVVGLFRLGFHEYDTRLAYTGLEDARHIAGARLTLFGVELRFHKARRALEVEPEVVARLGYEPRIIDWETLNHNLFRALLMQKLIIALFLMIIIIVAAFNIIASLTMIVLSKVREIAILSAMGARKAGLLRLFLVAGSLVGFVGVGLGLVYGLAVCGLASPLRLPAGPQGLSDRRAAGEDLPRRAGLRGRRHPAHLRARHHLPGPARQPPARGRRPPLELIGRCRLAGARRKCWSLSPISTSPCGQICPLSSGSLQARTCTRLPQGFRPPHPPKPHPSQRQPSAPPQSGSARGSFGATGGREPARSACTVMLIRNVGAVWSAQERSGVWWRGGVGWGGRSRHATDRKCAPASCHSRVERSARTAKCDPRQRPALPDGAGRRRADPYPNSPAAMGAAGARASYSLVRLGRRRFARSSLGGPASYFEGHLASMPSLTTIRRLSEVSVPLATTSAPGLKLSGTRPRYSASMMASGRGGRVCSLNL